MQCIRGTPPLRVVRTVDQEPHARTLAPAVPRMVESPQQVLEVDASTGGGLRLAVALEQLIVTAAARHGFAGTRREHREADARVVRCAADLAEVDADARAETARLQQVHDLLQSRQRACRS